MYRVTILQHRLLHYRTELFERLRLILADQGVELCLVHGQASSSEKQRNDEGLLPWAVRVENLYWSIGGTDLCWQKLPVRIKQSDLIIMMQENRLISNYPLILGQGNSNYKLAFWGHGANFQKNKTMGLREKWKRIYLKKVDWWFAYTEATVDILENTGFPSRRITCLNNAIDNHTFKEELNKIYDQDIVEYRDKLGIAASDKVGLFCGSIYKEKRIDLLLSAGEIIKKLMPDFQLVIIGDGPYSTVLHEFVEKNGWIKWLGMKRGTERAICFRMADVILNPGLVGLHVLDAFCAGLPMITTDDAKHSPEIVYLEHMKNGVVTKGDDRSYAGGVIKVLGDQVLHKALSEEAVKSSEKYTLEEMVNRFVSGILECLEIQKR